MTDTAPDWLLTMRTISGMSETAGSADNPKILAMRDEIARRWASTPGMEDYCDLYTHDSIPWCGLTVAYCMTMAGIHPVFGPTDTDRFLWAQAWDDPSFGGIIKTPRVGCVVVMGREGGGHVTLYERTEGSKYVCRGGNQSDAINVQSYAIDNVISLVWPNTAGPLPPAPRRTLSEGDNGSDVAALQTTLGVPADGDFGPVTEAAVMGFQSGWGLQVDGVVGPMTWDELDALDAKMAAGSDGLEPELVDAISAVVAESDIAGHSWDDRGTAPPGYLQGMALTFGLAVQQFGNDIGAALAMSEAMTDDAETDALKWYEAEFKALGMDNSADGLTTLRHLFVMLIGLGMRESSGKYYEGRDTTATNVTSTTAEAGLFQTSANIKTASPHMDPLWKQYWLDPNGFLPVFSTGLYPTSSGLKNYGTGEGAAFQWLSKYTPSFAAMVTALGLRTRRKHWGPINRKECEIVRDCDDMLIAVQALAIAEVPPPEPPPDDVATVDIVATGPVRITVNGVPVG